MAFDLKKIFSSLQTAQSPQTTKVVGIDFGSSSIKVVELESKDDVIALSTYGELQLGPYGSSDMGTSVRLTTQKKVEALVDVMRESGVTAKSGVLALPLADSFVTVISLAAKTDEDISSRIRVEARKYIPLPLTDVALEWTEIPQKDQKTALTREIMLAAIQNTALSELTAITDAIQMGALPAEIELFSTARATSKTTDVGSIAIIDIGAQMTKVYITEGGYLRRLHRIQAGGSYITKVLAKELDLSFENAENVKRNYQPADARGVQIKQIVENVCQPAFSECKRVINQHELRTGTPIERIVLTGGCTLFPELLSIARYALDRDVVLSNPFNKVAYPAFLEDTLATIAPVFTVALGAALRQFE